MKLLPVLSLCLLSCSAAFGSKVVTVEEGSDVILPCLLGKNIESELVEWTKDGRDVFDYNAGAYQSYNSRVSHFPDDLMNGDASIKIRQTVKDDSGKYTCSFPDLHQTFDIQLVVEPPVKVIVEQDSDAILPCSLDSNIQSTLFDWRKDYYKDAKDVFMYDDRKQDLSRQSEQFRGRVSHFPDELKNGNASIKITETKLADGGNYTCIFPFLQPERRFNIELVVAPILKDRSCEKISGAAPTPVIKRPDETKDGALLQCEVQRASPKPEVVWQNSHGNNISAEEPNVLEEGGRFFITLNTTVTKTGRYRCVATQKEIRHQTQAEMFVFISESSSSCTGGIVAAVFVSLLVVVILAVLVKKGCIPLNCKTRLL